MFVLNVSLHWRVQRILAVYEWRPDAPISPRRRIEPMYRWEKANEIVA